MEQLSEITTLLNGMRTGEAASFEQLVPLVYDEMRQLARRQLGGRGGEAFLLFPDETLGGEKDLDLGVGQECGAGEVCDRLVLPSDRDRALRASRATIEDRRDEVGGEVPEQEVEI